jgi:predicted Na+-dependent transporter
MLSLIAAWNEWLGKHMFLLVLSALFLGFTIGLPPLLNLSGLSIGLFAYATFVTALGTSFREFLSVLSRPKIPLWILFLIHIATPLLAWLLGTLLYPDDYYSRLGYLVGSSIPIGVTSILWTALTNGNVAVSLVAVTLDTLVVPVFLPLFFKVIVGQALHFDYAAMIHQLLWMITAPSLLGMLLHDFSKEKTSAFAGTFGGCTSKLAFAVVIYINATIVAPEIHWSWPIFKTVLVSFLMVAGGYLLGFAGSLPFKQSSREITMAMVYCVGLRNVSFGVVLALAYFPTAVAVPITLLMLFQQPLAAAIPHIYRRFKAPSGQEAG